MKIILAILLACSISAYTQTDNSAATDKPSPTFKGHRVGETAETFFSTAQMFEHPGTSANYCRNYLNDPKIQKAHDKAQKNMLDINAVIASSDFSGCSDVMSALNGGTVQVGNRFAHEFGTGHVSFIAGKLAQIDMVLDVGYDDVLPDMNKKLGVAGLEDKDVLQNAYGAQLIARKASWEAAGLVVQVKELRSFRSYLGTEVTVVESSVLDEVKKQQESRPNTLD